MSFPEDCREQAPRPSPSEQVVEFAPLGVTSGAKGRSIDIARFALSMWKPMTLGLIGGCLMGLAAYSYLGPTFEANTQVKVSQKAAMPEGGGQANRYGDRGEHVYLIKSDVICQRALSDFGLSKLPEFDGADDAAKEIAERLTVKRTAGQDSSFDNLIDITYVHADPEVARAVVDAVVKAYGDYLQKNRETNSDELFTNITRQLREAEQTIRELDKEYRGWRDAAPFFLSTPVIVTSEGTAMPGQSPYMVELDRINTAVRDNMLKRTAVEAKLKTLKDMLARGESREAMQMRILWSLSTGTVSSGGEGGGGAGGGSILTSPPGKAELDSQLLAARLLEHRLLHVLGPNHADVVDVRRQIDAIVRMYAQNGFAPPVLEKLNNVENRRQPRRLTWPRPTSASCRTNSKSWPRTPCCWKSSRRKRCCRRRAGCCWRRKTATGRNGLPTREVSRCPADEAGVVQSVARPGRLPDGADRPDAGREVDEAVPEDCGRLHALGNCRGVWPGLLPGMV